MSEPLPADATRPLFSLLIAVADPDPDLLGRAIASVQAQTLAAWELVCVRDGRPESPAGELLRSVADGDPRIIVVERRGDRDRAAALNAGLARAAGAFVAAIDARDLLAPDCLTVMAGAIDANPDAVFLYSDEDQIGSDGGFLEAIPKPDWSPERFRWQNYAGRLSVLRTSAVREVGSFRSGFGGAEEHDLALRLTESGGAVVHVPETLYHRQAPGPDHGAPGAEAAGQKAVQEHLDRIGIRARVHLGPTPGTYRIERTSIPAGLVSVVIPTRGSTGVVRGSKRVFVTEAVRSLLARAGPVDLEIVVVYDDVTPATVLNDLRAAARDRLILVPYHGEFNFSRKCNLGAVASHGRWLVMLNDDTELITPGFVQTLVAPLLEDGVGMTGARLLLEDGSIQHAGVVYRRGRPGHAYYREPDDTQDATGTLLVDRECSALTAACVALRRTVFEDVGGFTERLPVNYNDVDLSLKVRSLGLRLVWLSRARAYHFDSQTRNPTTHQWERDILTGRWPAGDRDPYMPGA